MARSSYSPQPTVIPAASRPGIRVPLGWFWPLFWSGLMVGSGVLGVWATLLLTRIPPLPDCETVTSSSRPEDRLICAQTAMQSSNATSLVQAVQLTANWSENHMLYAEARPVLVEASQRLLKQATAKMHQGDLTLAVDWASQIPQGTPLRATAQARIWEWQQEWQTGQTIQSNIQQAIVGRDWESAEKSLQRLKLLSSDYWLSRRHSELQQAKQKEQSAWAQVDQARALAETGDPINIGEALTLAQQVDLNSQAWQAAQADVDRWSQNLLLYSFQRWELGDVDGAIAAVQKLPPDPNLAPQARDLIQFSHAKRLAAKAMQQQPGYLHLFQLMEAIEAARQIHPDSTFYATAQESLQVWQGHVEDLRTLQFANVVASLRQPATFAYATQLAWTVEPESPRRLQAQTLIAYWEDEVERIEDRPYLRKANSLAQPGSIAAFQAAIAEASKVSLGRALRIDAQTLIADWTNRIETIQDQPILNSANTLANEGKLKEAIATAEGITPDRALYDQAQTMVAGWTETVQIREDTPILEKAKDLAYKGELTNAIAVASQIAPGRALYNEAQNAMSLWEAERAYILRIRAAEADVEADEEQRDSSEASSNSPPRRPAAPRQPSPPRLRN
ncbi:MAG: hypothetical protein AAGH78_16285 [Cyanobacteria bacterium P01_H01_bin.58]